ncbi:MAG: hypothetical protein EXR62_17580 [Chloroflexi bacterium]|nr:hypothetical protein [Chloroflexota bacterium]
MTIEAILPLISTIVTLVFAAMVLYRFSLRGTPYLLMWGIGLVLYGLGTFAEFWFTFGWNDFMFRIWYLCGAVLTAAWLGQGTIFLLARRSWAQMGVILLLIFSLIGVYLTFIMPLNSANFDPHISLSVQYRTLMGTAPIRTLTPIFNIYGTLGLVGGAVYSAWLFWHKRVLPARVWGNVFIALGGLSPALGGTLSRLGSSSFLYSSELIGVILIFCGYMLAVSSPEAQRRVTSLPIAKS